MATSADDARQARLRDLPKVDEVIRRPDLERLGLPRWALVEAVRREIDGLRRAIVEGSSTITEVSSDDVARRARALARPSLRPVVNATGVVLHTNLGRAPLAEEAIRRVGEIARGYSNLEYHVGERARGSRHDHLERILADLTGAEAAVVVNNNAAAVLVLLAAMAAGREVIVSRGELVEIGGSFRIPDVMRWSGARLVEVGTTNKTRLSDVEQAIGPDTALLLKVHPSNFAMVGFVADVPLSELAALGRRRGVPVVMDLGSGSLVDPAALDGAGLPPETTVRAAVAAGAALVSFSGDKLLGGPQAGIVVGTRTAVDRVRRHPLIRTVRPDKMTLAALEATLELYREGRAERAVPALAMLGARPEALAERAREARAAIGAAVPGIAIDVIEHRSAVGGGALPTAEPPSWAIALRATDGRTAEDLDALMRSAEPPVIGRIQDGALLLDLRTVLPDQVSHLAASVRRLGS